MVDLTFNYFDNWSYYKLREFMKIYNLSCWEDVVDWCAIHYGAKKIYNPPIKNDISVRSTILFKTEEDKTEFILKYT